MGREPRDVLGPVHSLPFINIKYSPPSTAMWFLSFSPCSWLSRKVHTFSKVAVIFEGMKKKANVLEVLGESGGGTATTVPLWERLQWD